MRTVESVRAGEEVCISYVDTLLPPRQRQARLLRKYSFLCSCPACNEDPSPGVGAACLFTVRTPGSDAWDAWELQLEEASLLTLPPKLTPLQLRAQKVVQEAAGKLKRAQGHVPTKSGGRSSPSHSTCKKLCRVRA